MNRQLGAPISPNESTASFFVFLREVSGELFAEAFQAEVTTLLDLPEAAVMFAVPALERGEGLTAGIDAPCSSRSRVRMQS